MSRIRLFLALSVCALVALPAAAQAKPHLPNFGQTVPHAAKLCAKSDRGKLPKKLQASAADVAAACTTLRADFTTARTTFAGVAKPIEQQAVAAYKTLRATCKQARKDGDKAACKQARKDALATFKSLRAQLKTAVQSYRTSIQTARKAFWDTIKALPGVTVTPDSGTPPAPSADVPTDGQVAAA